MSKYAPLGEFLSRQKSDTVSLSFTEVEKILGFKLPESAYRQRAWWSNNPNNSVMTKVWRGAQFRSRDVDMERRKVVFQRKEIAPPTPPATTGQGFADRWREWNAHNDLQINARHHPLRGAIKGMLKLVEGTDLTKPAGPWNDR